jgi:hypothetical protein
MPEKNVEYEIPDATQDGGGQIEQGRSGTERPFTALILFLACLFSGALPSERSFYALFFAGLQVEGVTLDLLDDVFLLHLALETAQSILEGFALLKPYFCQICTPPNSSGWTRIFMTRI